MYSFAERINKTFGDKYLNLVWSHENKIDPFKMSHSANKKIKFRCLNNPTHEYYRMAYLFWETQNCPICEKQKNSVGVKHPKSIELWSNLNSTSPYDYSSQSSDTVFWKCNNNIHDDYKRTVKNSVNSDFECPLCRKPKPRGVSPKRIDLVGKKFGELTVTSFAYSNNLVTCWNCECSCGANVVKNGNDMKAGKITTCGNKSIHRLGKNNSNWRDGSTEKNYSERYTKEYSEWHRSILNNDDYTCQCCGQYGGNLQVHHIMDFATHEELRTDITNGITLCESCHDSTVSGSFHNTYGTCKKTPQELEEYINNKRKQLGITIPFSIDSYLSGNILKPEDIFHDFAEQRWIFNN